MIKRTIAILLLIFLSACQLGGDSTQPVLGTPELTLTLTPAGTHTPLPTVTQTTTPAPTTTATLIPLTDEELVMLNQVYRILLYIQIDMRTLNEIAEKVQAQELVGVETFGALMVLATVVNEVDTAIQAAAPPDLIREDWEAALQMQVETKLLVENWVNEEIDSTGMLTETQTRLDALDELMERVEMSLAEYYGFDQEELRQNREAVVESVNEIFATPEP